MYNWTILLSFSFVFLFLALIHSFIYNASRYWSFLGLLLMWVGMVMSFAILIGIWYFLEVPIDAMIPFLLSFKWWYILVMLGPSFLYFAISAYRANRVITESEEDDYES